MTKSAPQCPAVWSRPTRRTFVALLTAAAAALVVERRTKPGKPVEIASSRPALWIGHC